MSGENIIHFAAVRIRVVGTGNLVPTLYGYDDVLSSELPSLAMSSPNSREMTRLCNFTSQAMRLKLETREINETMKVNHFSVFMKPLWADYPA